MVALPRLWPPGQVVRPDSARHRGASIKGGAVVPDGLFPRGRSGLRSSRPVTRAAARPHLREGSDPAARAPGFPGGSLAPVGRSPDNPRGVVGSRALWSAGTRRCRWRWPARSAHGHVPCTPASNEEQGTRPLAGFMVFRTAASSSGALAIRPYGNLPRAPLVPSPTRPRQRTRPGRHAVRRAPREQRRAARRPAPLNMVRALAGALQRPRTSRAHDRARSYFKGGRPQRASAPTQASP